MRKISESVRREDRRDRVMALAATGETIRAISRELGFSVGTIHNDIHARLEAAASQCPSTAKYRHLQRVRLNQLLNWWWEPAMNDLKALGKVLRILAQESRLLGLDAPQQQQHSVDVELPQKPDMKVLTDKDVQALLEYIGSAKNGSAKNPS